MEMNSLAGDITQWAYMSAVFIGMPDLQGRRLLLPLKYAMHDNKR